MDHCDLIDENGHAGITVHKMGANSGAVIGKLITFRYKAPKGWYVESDSEDDGE
ncbi:hypothetical protein CC80DRAFT_493072 [Byssothecium circinans]|uniref:Uncharacterized protein n=1 Tax=Byssothecium circinans TaxID=147558 RepID=A0A6A5U390_9PLEO|nr:hypothetical protein CC80DRAFT_493072 [Byssothecium circinans]